MNNSLKNVSAASATVREVIAAVIRQIWILLAFLSLLLILAIIWFFQSGDRVLAAAAWWFFKTATFGLAGSYILHESAHLLILRRIGTITHLAVERTAWRISIVSAGAMTAGQVARVAVAGPLACVGMGALLWLSDLDRQLAWWYLAHAVFLLPVFGDGRNLCAALQSRRGYGPGKP